MYLILKNLLHSIHLNCSDKFLLENFRKTGVLSKDCRKMQILSKNHKKNLKFYERITEKRQFHQKNLEKI